MGIYISYQSMEPEEAGKLPMGASRMGRLPDVPKDHPHIESNFFMQINVKDVQGLDTKGLLPKTGVLSIYRNAVEYYPDESVLVQPTLSEEEKRRVISFRDTPDFVCKLVFDQDAEPSAELFEEKPYYRFSDGFNEPVCLKKEYFGYSADSDLPDTSEISYSRFFCEQMARGYKYLPRLSKEELHDMVEKAKDWICLFSVATCDGCCGLFDFVDAEDAKYYWIRKSDLENLKFDRIQVICDMT